MEQNFVVAASAGAEKRAHLEERRGHTFRKDLGMRDIISAAQVTTISRPVHVHDWAA